MHDTERPNAPGRVSTRQVTVASVLPSVGYSGRAAGLPKQTWALSTT